MRYFYQKNFFVCCLRIAKAACRVLSFMMAFAFIFISFPANAQEKGGDVKIGINVYNRLEVALAVGPTTIDYSTFEEDLRGLLSAKSPPVLPGDLFISAATAVSANTTSEFQWWIYDHTAPAALAPVRTDLDHQGHAFNSPTYYPNYAAFYNYLIGQANLGSGKLWNTATAPTVAELANFRGASAGNKISDADRIYIEYNEGGAQSGGTKTDKTSADYLGTRHPYDGHFAHMMSSNNGATMDFYGYGSLGYKDFRFLPNTQKTKKTFEFAIKEDVAYDALDGVGFFFNTDISGSYEARTQTMTGFLLFLEYSSGKGANIKIYKFKDVNTWRFHQARAGINTATASASTLAAYTEDGTNKKFELVSGSNVYVIGDVFRRIKMEIFPTYARVYYKGSPSNAAVLTTPIDEDARPINFNTGITGMEVDLDHTYMKGFGFGPMGSYLSHGCAQPTHLTLQNLSMNMDKVRSLLEIVRAADWQENTKKFIVNLNEEPIEDFENTFIRTELINRLAEGDEIYYIGWCGAENVSESQQFMTDIGMHGVIVNMDNPATKSYWEQLQAIADEIYERYQRKNSENIVLVTENVILNVDNADQSNTADPEWPEGKWKVVHNWDGTGVFPDKFDNNDGIYSRSGQFVSDLDLKFDKVGTYDIYYCGLYMKTIIAHKAPVANFSISLDGKVPTFKDQSYDPDDLSKGIVSSSWAWTDIDVEGAVWKTGLTLEQLQTDLAELVENDTYAIRLEVTDKYGATSSLVKTVRFITATGDAEYAQPYASFDINPYTVIRGVSDEKVFIINNSYDFHGLPISHSYTLTHNNVTTPIVFDGEYEIIDVSDASKYPAGDYIITLLVTSKYGEGENETLTSEPVTRTFKIVVDKDAPTAVETNIDGNAFASRNFSVNTPVLLTFSDEEGGSGFNQQRFFITTNAAPIATADLLKALEDLKGQVDKTPESLGWSNESYSTSRIVYINNVGSSYIYWYAIDNAGNPAVGSFGPYTLTKQATKLKLTVSPSNEVTYPDPIELVAEFDEGTNPSGTVYFYIDGEVVGSAPIINGKATYTYTPKPSSKTGNITMKAYYPGDSNYDASDSSVDGAINFNIKQNTTIEISVGNQTDKVYDGEPFDTHDIVVTKSGENIRGSSLYEIRYTGRNGTVYNSTTPPTDAGDYTVT
ncbi:MAG: Ig-like domain-containing protein, partial [Tannerella sp.]|nr:Ig-like domain-containing protein [Tannerella sp.]